MDRCGSKVAIAWIGGLAWVAFSRRGLVDRCLEMGFGSMGGGSVGHGWQQCGLWLGFLFMVVRLVTKFLCICWWLGSLFNGGGRFCVNGGGWVFGLMVVVGFVLMVVVGFCFGFHSFYFVLS